MARRVSRRPVTRIAAEGLLAAEFDDVVVEEPLDIRIGDRTLAITMRTPGDDFELAAGFCLTEGVLDGGATIGEIRFCPDVEELNTVEVRLRGEPVWHDRSLTLTAACGVCGKTSIDDVRRRLPAVASGPTFAAPLLADAADHLRDEQPTFARTGGLHAAGLLIVGGDWLAVREDIGRHNAVDKVVGWALLNGRLPLAGTALVVSGRAGFEIVQKALAASIPAVVAVGAPSSLAIDLALDGGMTLCGFARRGGLTVYSGAERVSTSA